MENHKNRKKKINLEDLDKKNIYSVPDAYFDKLSYSIQQRIQTKEEVSWFEKLKTSRVKYVIPAFTILLVLTIYFFLGPSVKQVAVNNQPALKDSLKRKEVFKQDEKITIISPEKNNPGKKTVAVTGKDATIKEAPLPTKNNDPIEDNIPTQEPLRTAQEYLAGVSKEDIKMYLEVNDMSESQMEEIILEN